MSATLLDTDAAGTADAGKVSTNDFHFVMRSGKVSMNDFHFVMRNNSASPKL